MNTAILILMVLAIVILAVWIYLINNLLGCNWVQRVYLSTA